MGRTGRSSNAAASRGADYVADGSRSGHYWPLRNSTFLSRGTRHEHAFAKNIRRIAVIGAGVIGSGWVTYFLARGFEVRVTDSAPGAKDRLAAFIRQAWPAVGELGLAPDANPDGWTFLPDIEQATEGAGFVQENAPDNVDAKRQVFAQIDAVAPPEVAIASSSSALLMTPIQKGLGHPERCFLGHPFNPPHMIPLVEVSGGAETDPAVLDWAVDFYAAIGKKPARLNREISGHIAGRLGAAVWREAVSLVDQGIADAAAVDAAMTYGPGLRYALAGPTMIFHMGGVRKGSGITWSTWAPARRAAGRAWWRRS